MLSLERMQRVRAVDAANATLTIEAGATLAAAQEAARDAGMLFPLSLASEGSCTVGGVLSTNAGGTAVLRYGNARELVLGLEVVLADGRVWEGLRGLRKDNTGYDLKHLFVGAEGTLGVITAAVLKLFPAPRSQATGVRGRRRPGGGGAPARDAARAARRPADRLRAHRRPAARAVPQAPSRPARPAARPPVVRAGPGGRCRAGRADGRATSRRRWAWRSRTGSCVDATIARSQAQAAALWALRENISEGQRREGPNIKHDIARAGVARFPRSSTTRAGRCRRRFPGVRFVTFGHLGDGNLHYNLSAPEGEDARAFMDHAPAANRIVHDLVARATAGASAPSTASAS